jgi:membrane-associated phospholipid phosphatase
MSPLVALLLLALGTATGVAWLSLWASRVRPGRQAAQEAGDALAGRSLHPRLDPSSATGLALTLALVAIVGLGVLLAVLTFLVRSQNGLVRFDRTVADWGRDHATALSDHVLEVITFVGQPMSIVVLAAVFAGVETMRTRSRWIVPFVFIVVAGNGALTTTIKHLADRVRPTVNPIAATLGPSFPSGHSSWTAAFLAAAALVLSRGTGRRSRAVLAGAAAGLAVAVAATRILLGVHWISDVIAGLALGWIWFAVCAIAFGGRLLRFGATAEEVDRRVRSQADRDEAGLVVRSGGPAG